MHNPFVLLCSFLELRTVTKGRMKFESLFYTSFFFFYLNYDVTHQQRLIYTYSVFLVHFKAIQVCIKGVVSFP